LRTALDQSDKAARLTGLRALARTAKFDELGAINFHLLGNSLFDAGDGSLAESVLRTGQERHPGDVWVNYSLGKVLENKSRRDEAIRFYTAARSVRPETAHDLAHVLEKRGDCDEAIAVFRDLKRLRPGSGRHLGCLGRALKHQGRAPEAAAILAEAEAANREAVRLRPDDAQAHFSLGFAFAIQEKLDQAIAEYRKAIAIHPETVEFHDNLCQFLGQQGKLDEAAAEYRAAIRIQPGFANAYNSYGHILFRVRKDYDAAAAEFRKATRLEPDNAVYHDNLGMALQKLGKLDEAIVEYRTASDLNPSLADAYLGVGEMLEFWGKVDEAIAEYRKAVRLDPNEDDAHNLLAWALIKTPDRGAGAHIEALEHARQAVTLNPGDGAFQKTLALAEYRAGHWANSVAAAQRSIELTKGVDASNWFFLAMAHCKQGHKEWARSFFDKATSWTSKNHSKKADLFLLWREAAAMLGQPGPDAGLVELPAEPFAR
jgi:tetratricopeptide (TPR) repeat protein